MSERVEKVLNYLREYQNKGGIDTFKLMYKCRNTRPSNEIVILRKLGYNIATITHRNKSTGKNYYKYLLISEPGA